MKKPITFFVMLFSTIWNFFFGKKKVEKVVEEKISTPQVQYSNRPMVPPHNNRRNKRGRLIQYINTGEGRQRAIYHSAK